jgi:hypothetical protein
MVSTSYQLEELCEMCFHSVFFTFKNFEQLLIYDIAYNMW